MNGADGGKRQPQVAEQMARLEKETALLSEAIETLTGRLEKVLTTASPSPSIGDGGDMNNSLVPLAESIRNYQHSVALVNGKVRDVLDRLEL